MKDLVKIEDAPLLAANEQPGDRNPAKVYLASLAPTGRRSMEGRLREVAKLFGSNDPLNFPWHQIRFQHVSAVRAHLLEAGKAPSTVNTTLCAIRGVAKAAFNLGLTDAETYQRLCTVKAAKGDRLPAGRSLTYGELQALFAACAEDESPAGSRDAAILAVLYGAGLRRAELIGLNVSHLNRETGRLKIRGKGNRERYAYLTNGAADALDAWLAIRGTEKGPLFVPVNKSGNLTFTRLTEQAIYYVLRKRAAAANVKSCSPHDLRRTFVGDLLDKGIDISTVQQLAGHADVTTTARYDRRGEATKAKAAESLHVPYAGPGGRKSS